jgi:hypothetical protein
LSSPVLASEVRAITVKVEALAAAMLEGGSGRGRGEVKPLLLLLLRLLRAIRICS